MPRFLSQRGLTTVARNIFRKIVAASESRGIENCSTNHYRNAGHFIDKIIRKNLLVFEIPFQRDAGGHDGGEFGIVHDIAVRVRGEVFFRDLFRNPTNASGYAGKSCCGRPYTNGFHESSDTRHHHNVLVNFYRRL